jgi:soluble lytic murein transglycosylase
MLDWIEQIPFSETRNYVQRVIENMAIYRARDPQAAAQDHPMTRWLA